MSGIVDLHCDTLLCCFLEKESLRSRRGHINLELLKQTGALAQCFAIFLASEDAAKNRDIQQSPYELFQKVYEYYLGQLCANSDMVAPAFHADDVEVNRKNSRVSSILTVEDCVLLEGRVERVDELADKGVCMAGLTWNYENSLGYPCRNEEEEHGRGLKPFGIAALERMNERGIIADVSHLSGGGFYDVAKYGKKPFVASHSCAKALCAHRRNLTDDQLRVIGETGSVVGVNFYSLFLTEGADYSSSQRIVEHALHIADKAGVESLALGSDFDGIECGLEMESYGGYPQLIEKLSKHFTDDQIEKICGGNFMRVFRECGAKGQGETARTLLRRKDEEYKNPILERID